MRYVLTVALTASMCLIPSATLSRSATPAGAPRRRPTGKKRPVLPEDITAIRWVTAPSLSADGKTLAHVIVEWDNQEGQNARRKSTLWLAALDKQSPHRNVASKHQRVSRPRWSPDGRSLAFLSRREDEGKNQIFLLAADGSSATRLTDSAEGVRSYQWSSNGKEIAFLSSLPDRSDKPDREAPIEVGHTFRNTQLFVVNVADRQTVHVKTGKHVVDFSWAPDSKQFAVALAATSDPDDVFKETALVVVDRKSGEVRTLSTNVGGGLNLAWSRDGKTIAFPEFTQKKIARRLALIPATGGKCRYLLDDYRGYPLDPIQWSADSRHLWVRTFERTRVQLLRVDVVKGDLERRASEVQNFWAFATSADDRTIVLTAETGQVPPNLVVLTKGKMPRTLTDMNPQLAELRLGTVREIQWKSTKDGRILYGVLVTPPGYRAGTPSPTIVELHGGPQGMWWSGWLGTYLSRGQYFASHGYVVFLPNPRGSINDGIPFVEANFRDWGGGDYQDVMDGVDTLVKQKIADPARLAIGGGSYGGYLTAWTTTQTNRFRAAVVDAGFTDLITWNLTNDVAHPLRRYLGGDEIRDRPFYLSRSPLTYLDRCRTPTLVLHGEKDLRVPLAQGRAWYRGLKLRGTETEMVVYPGAGHGYTRHAHQIDVMRRVLAWYEQHLKEK
jgi:dipeptidyl aminopeptidase/acylaminoacyl peptidase